MALIIWTVPLRLVLGLIALLLFALASLISVAGHQGGPLKGWRRSVMQLCRPVSMACAFLVGFSVRVKGWHHYKAAMNSNIRVCPLMFVRADLCVLQLCLFNHVSYMDAFVLVGLMGCSGISKESNKNLPLLGYCIRGLQNIYLPDHRQIIKADGNENKSSTRVDSVSAQISRRARDPRYPMLALAPEGTCGNGRCVLKFRTGAFISGDPVLLVLLKYKTSGIHPGWTVMHEPMHFLRLMCQFYHIVEVEFLEPYFPSNEEKANAQLYADNIRKRMADALGVPMVDESYNHMYALSKLGISIGADGHTILDRDNRIDSHGIVDLTSVFDKTSS